MKAKELRDKTQDELKMLLKDLQAKVCQLRFDISGKQVRNFREIKHTKKDIARVMTTLHNQIVVK